MYFYQSIIEHNGRVHGSQIDRDPKTGLSWLVGILWSSPGTKGRSKKEV